MGKLGISRVVPERFTFSFGLIINPLLTKFIQSTLLNIGLVLFLRFYGPRRRIWPEYLAILTSGLVNNPYELRVRIYINIMAERDCKVLSRKPFR